jgi:antitoxin CcdA
MGTEQSTKRTVNLSIDSELLDEARGLDINISEVVEQRLRSLVRAQQEKRRNAEREKAWKEENRDAIASINAFLIDTACSPTVFVFGRKMNDPPVRCIRKS